MLLFFLIGVINKIKEGHVLTQKYVCLRSKQCCPYFLFFPFKQIPSQPNLLLTLVRLNISGAGRKLGYGGFLEFRRKNQTGDLTFLGVYA
jgi:hypothetical protein